jgi:hypothetical protein
MRLTTPTHALAFALAMAACQAPPRGGGRGAEDDGRRGRRDFDAFGADRARATPAPPTRGFPPTLHRRHHGAGIDRTARPRAGRRRPGAPARRRHHDRRRVQRPRSRPRIARAGAPPQAPSCRAAARRRSAEPRVPGRLDGPRRASRGAGVVRNVGRLGDRRGRGAADRRAAGRCDTLAHQRRVPSGAAVGGRRPGRLRRGRGALARARRRGPRIPGQRRARCAAHVHRLGAWRPRPVTRARALGAHARAAPFVRAPAHPRLRPARVRPSHWCAGADVLRPRDADRCTFAAAPRAAPSTGAPGPLGARVAHPRAHRVPCRPRRTRTDPDGAARRRFLVDRGLRVRGSPGRLPRRALAGGRPPARRALQRHPVGAPIDTRLVLRQPCARPAYG